MASKLYPKRSLYNRRKYWFHVSTTLREKHIRLIPWDEDKACNRCSLEPKGKRICVAPTIEQCITAIPYYLGTICTVYRTKSAVRVSRPKGVFDVRVTQEGWLHKPTSFVKVGILKFQDIEKELNVEDVIGESASGDDAKYARDVLNWWKQARVHRFIKKA